MTNPKGSKSVRTTKPNTTTEVALDASTVAVLPNPADAPAPPKRGRKKPQPTVAAKAEVPAWVRKAEAGPPVATAVEVTPEPVPEAPAPKKGRATKAAKTKPAAKATLGAAPGSLRAIGDAWLESLRAAGHTPSTVSSYGNDLAIAYEHLGADTVAATITEKQIAGFNASKGVVKKANGKPKAQPTILKTRRALRLALIWAEQKKLIAKAPYAAKTPA
jgi:hypothetical protein